jgi:hypothetical protein
MYIDNVLKMGNLNFYLGRRISSRAKTIQMSSLTNQNHKLSTTQIWYFKTFKEPRARINKRIWSPGINPKELIPPAYLAWRAGTSNMIVVPSRLAGNQFLGSLKGLQIQAHESVPRIESASLCSLAGRYDSPFPTRFLGLIDCITIPALHILCYQIWATDQFMFYFVLFL